MTTSNLKKYKVGDIVAVRRLDKPDKAISCKVISKGLAETKLGALIVFTDDRVLWILGKNGKWPKFVQFK